MATESVTHSSTSIYNKTNCTKKNTNLKDIESSGGKDLLYKLILDKAQRLQQTAEDLPKGKDTIRVIAMINDKDIIYQHGQIHDSIHGIIKMSNLAFKIVDTPYYQRLRSLKQLGSANKIYPNASHSRFEHSIGVYHLASRILTSIKMNSDPTLLNSWLADVPELKDYYTRTYKELNHEKLDDYVCELVKIAALCHDLGHGPFSHVFDDVFIPAIRAERELNNLNNKVSELNISDKLTSTSTSISTHLDHHEARSCAILELIIKKDPFLSSIIRDGEIRFMQDLIDPRHDQIGFIYQIVSNGLNGIDVDKFDYLVRDATTLGLKLGFEYDRLIKDAKVIDNITCFQEQMCYEVYSIFSTRYRMHRQVYSHKTVISIQYMICEIMMLIDPIVKIYESIYDIEKFCKLTDSYILETVKFLHLHQDSLNYDDKYKDRINRAYKILEQIDTRDLYKLISKITTKEKLSDEDLIMITQNPDIDQSKIQIHRGKIGFVSGQKKNPTEDLYLYRSKKPDTCFKPNRAEMSSLVPDTYQEHICMIYVKDRSEKDLINRLSELTNQLINRIYPNTPVEI